jgi:cephalosporin-C deacetylase
MLKYIRPRNSSGPHPAVSTVSWYTQEMPGDWSEQIELRGHGLFGSRHWIAVDREVCLRIRVSVTGTTFKGHIIRGLDDPPEKLVIQADFS